MHAEMVREIGCLEGKTQTTMFGFDQGRLKPEPFLASALFSLVGFTHCG